MPLYPYHRQDLPEWCGAACIQMILEKNQLMEKDHPTQQPIFDDVRDSGWNASPKKLNITLNRYLEGRQVYELFSKPADLSGAASTADAEEVLAAVKASAADGVLIPSQQYKHWVLVTGAFTDKSPYSDAGQLHLKVNDPLTAGLKVATHADHGKCAANQCGPSPEIWGPVKISDFLLQLRKGSFCVRKPAKLATISGELVTALEGAATLPVKSGDEVLEAAMKHYDFFRSHFAGEIPRLTPDGVEVPRIPSSSCVLTAGPTSTGGYQQRWQVRLVGKTSEAGKTFSVWVELCQRSLRLSRIRYIDHKPDWWAGGSCWF